MEAKFVLSLNKLKKQILLLRRLGVKISYSYKTNNYVGLVIQRNFPDVDFSIHNIDNIEKIKNKKSVWFFVQAESKDKLKKLLSKGIIKFVIDNEEDLRRILEVIKKEKKKIWLSLRMKFKENRIGSGRYFVYGMPSSVINKIIKENSNNYLIEKIGIHIHRKSQNTSEWEIKQEIIDSLSKETLRTIDFLNLGGGLPVKYKNYALKNLDYIFKKIKQVKKFLSENNIQTYIEPGRFLAAPCINLETRIIQIHEKTIVVNMTIYNGALDTIVTDIKMLVKEELGEKEKGDFYLIKGNSPTRDDIFRYKVKLKNPKIGDKITFLNAGAYNYSTDFFGYKKLKTVILD